MNRGRLPVVGLESALRLARARGRTLVIRRCPESPADLVILENGLVLFVKIRRTEPFRLTPAELEAGNRDLLAQLRSIPDAKNIQKEFWAYSKYLTWRFFSVEERALVELDRAGLPLSPPPPQSLPGHPGNGPYGMNGSPHSRFAPDPSFLEEILAAREMRKSGAPAGSESPSPES